MMVGSGYMENPLRQNFFRAGHAHAGVHRDSFADLPNSGGRSDSSRPYALVRPNRSATGGDSNFLRVLFLRVAANCYRSQRSRHPALLRGSDSRPRGGHARCGVVEVSSDELGALPAPSA
jgi:hypothetical protein